MGCFATGTDGCEGPGGTGTRDGVRATGSMGFPGLTEGDAANSPGAGGVGGLGGVGLDEASFDVTRFGATGLSRWGVAGGAGSGALATEPFCWDDGFGPDGGTEGGEFGCGAPGLGIALASCGRSGRSFDTRGGGGSVAGVGDSGFVGSSFGSSAPPFLLFGGLIAAPRGSRLHVRPARASRATCRTGLPAALEPWRACGNAPVRRPVCRELRSHRAGLR